jgi:hypothetical protein
MIGGGVHVATGMMKTRNRGWNRYATPPRPKPPPPPPKPFLARDGGRVARHPQDPRFAPRVRLAQAARTAIQDILWDRREKRMEAIRAKVMREHARKYEVWAIRDKAGYRQMLRARGKRLPRAPQSPPVLSLGDHKYIIQGYPQAKRSWWPFGRRG